LSVHAAQEYLAHKVGITREYVNRILLKFEEVGLIRSIYRHMKSNIYRIANFFYIPKIRAKLARFFRACKWMPWKHLVFRNGGWQKRDSELNVTQYKQSNLYISNLSSKTSDIRVTVYRKRDFEEWPVDQNPIRQSIRNLKQLNLSRLGQINLMQFPDDAINAAAKHLSMLQHIKDPYAWFFDLCRDYCTQQGLPVNESLSQELKKKHITRDMPMTLQPLSSSQAAHLAAKTVSHALRDQPRQYPQKVEEVQRQEKYAAWKKSPEIQDALQRDKEKLGRVQRNITAMSLSELKQFYKGINPSMLEYLMKIAPEEEKVRYVQAMTLNEAS
jgi:ribosomal protein S25